MSAREAHVTMAAMVGTKSTGGTRGASQEGGEEGVAGDTTTTTSTTTIRKSVSLGTHVALMCVFTMYIVA